jgi:flagellar hook-basal body complex protein FliE
MNITPKAAAQAYSSLAGMARPGAGPAAGGGADFAGMVREAVGSLADQARAADTRTQAFAAGRADLVDVVTAVAETEVAMETLVSVRDRMVAAYEEIMRMPI